MLAQRVFQQSLRRAAAPGAVAKFAPAGLYMQSRPVATQNVPQDQGYQILEKQRLARPVSPHLAIYQPQITWYGSITHRLTGAVLSGGFYVFFAAYLVAPLTGWHLESQSLAAAFGALPFAAKVGIKSTLAWPFVYHSLNGVRHLVWDMGMWFKNKQVQQTGWAVVGLSTVGALALAMM
ncbi:succinate dehydrogenase cytochrome b560 subunit [Saccharata proteae CBS 121410]|uniref:Succinate dehydrogenase cytochrome b560 subunit n=1 Tax=Saccharata proteae CBS 121410 TaxID=1314787 RepID=A0A9P4LXF5_9PEZI|nr:succinate dehydrogenase cytochrome b560 subunit [Saccharata proteae CBS 121410]